MPWLDSLRFPEPNAITYALRTFGHTAYAALFPWALRRTVRKGSRRGSVSLKGLKDRVVLITGGETA